VLLARFERFGLGFWSYYPAELAAINCFAKKTEGSGNRETINERSFMVSRC
jgi:hypothetical protein